MYREKLVVFPIDADDFTVVQICITCYDWHYEINIDDEGDSVQVASYVLFGRGDHVPHKTYTDKTIRFVSQKEGVDDIDVTLDYDAPEEMVAFDKARLDKDAFVTDGNIYAKFMITINYVTGIQVSSIDFFQPSNCSDVVLIAGGKRFYVNKGFMATFSKVFQKMFFSNPEQMEFELDGVKWYQFYKLLQQIHPGSDICYDSDIRYLLELAHRFNIPSVVDDCKIDLKLDGNISCCDKIEYVDKYKMFDLLDGVMFKMKKSDLREIRESTFFKDLSAKTRDALYECALQFGAVGMYKEKKNETDVNK